MSGFVDLQVNGYHGIDFNSDHLTDEDLAAACDALRQDGVEHFLPTVITDDLRIMCRRIGRIAEAAERNAEVAQMMAGIHVEGPFISSAPGYIGAHPARHACDATADAAMRLVESGRGLVRLLTLAPERDEDGKVIRRLADENIVVAAGHCDPTRDQLCRAIDRGLTLFTHLGNGCPGEMHRHDNIIQRVLSLADRLAISFIADGHHVPYFALQNYLRVIPDENIIIVSDAITAAGLGPGKHRLAGQTVEVDDDLAAWAEGREHFAGCATTLPQMMELMHQQLGLSNDQISRWMIDNPRRLLGENTT